MLHPSIKYGRKINFSLYRLTLNLCYLLRKCSEIIQYLPLAKGKY